MPENGAGPKICETGGEGIIFPRPYEHSWPIGLRGTLYFFFLVWLLMGVGVISDIFMCAIEKITSKRTRKFNSETQRYATVLVWNPTVANLSLMALGSSAPEILLNVIEILGNNFFAGELGPSTIVGSAAFNLFCIIAVCVMAIPDGEVRRIKETQVYAITATFSIFAYLWLLVILMGSSPNIVEVWEGVLTFMFFWILLVLAYMADRGMLPGTKPVLGREQVIGMSKEELSMRTAELQKANGGNLTEEQVTKMLMIESQQQTYASYRVAATRKMVGGKKVAVEKKGGLLRSMSAAAFIGKKKVVPVDEEEGQEVSLLTKACVEFKAMKVAVLENAGHIDLWVTRKGALDQVVTVDYVTRDGTAKKAADYLHEEGTLTFEANELEKKIRVQIIDDIAYEEDEEFYVDLRDPKIVNNSTAAAKSGLEATLGSTDKVTVVIIDDDLPGMLAFREEAVTLQEQVQDYQAKFKVVRKAGSTGKISCSWTTEDGSAIAGTNYEQAEGVLEFENGETEKEIEVTIKARGRYERLEMFRIILTDVKGAKFDAETDGGADCCILTITIDSNQDAKNQVDRIMSSLQTNWDKSKVGHANWADQFKNALFVNGGEEDEDEDDEKGAGGPTISDYVLHFIHLPWKLLFAFVPPTDYCGGWICFFCSLGMIGVVTAVIGDIAALFGCICGLPDEITAITIVALGTSLPDTFASKSAAENDPIADASVGNVTGSNSVNVFLGLGLPWMIGSIFWYTSGPTTEWLDRYLNDDEIADIYKVVGDPGGFVVKAGSLAFSVGVFSGCAISCIAILAVRRKVCGGELGGPQPAKAVTSVALVSLWLLYVGLSSWWSLRPK
eukprot:TRINITY_DN107266_c0_g1_i1.p1 TRINITY_DN107266_c0_g1~~TRINITY_DN107266_c0_g1_i1.p1  ORF type:complete len:842 (+),score=150.92 TRINITY_DN107266_c0_g1_i1:86-2611(+)